MDISDGGAGLPAAKAAARPVRWSQALGDEIVRRTARGETLRAICAAEGMPSVRGVVRWTAEQAAFGAAIAEARAAAGRGVGRPSSYCRATAEAIFERLCAGEAMVRICEDADMPVASTAYKWLHDIAEFRDAVALAREIQADRLGAEGWEMAGGATPETAYVTDVRLKHLRWYAGKLSPRKYGTVRAVPAWEAAGWSAPKPEPASITLRTFRLEVRADGWRRVRASHADPVTREVVDEPPGEWKPPPRTHEETMAQIAEIEARRKRDAQGTAGE